MNLYNYDTLTIAMIKYPFLTYTISGLFIIMIILLIVITIWLIKELFF